MSSEETPGLSPIDPYEKRTIINFEKGSGLCREPTGTKILRVVYAFEEWQAVRLIRCGAAGGGQAGRLR